MTGTRPSGPSSPIGTEELSGCLKSPLLPSCRTRQVGEGARSLSLASLAARYIPSRNEPLSRVTGLFPVTKLCFSRSEAMRLSLFSQVAFAVAAFCASLPAWADEPAGPSRSDASKNGKSVTVFPIVLNSGKPIVGVAANMSKDVTELVGLFLERGGAKRIEIADTPFLPSEKDDLAKLAEA